MKIAWDTGFRQFSETKARTSYLWLMRRCYPMPCGRPGHDVIRLLNKTWWKFLEYAVQQFFVVGKLLVQMIFLSEVPTAAKTSCLQLKMYLVSNESIIFLCQTPTCWVLHIPQSHSPNWTDPMHKVSRQGDIGRMGLFQLKKQHISNSYTYNYILHIHICLGLPHSLDFTWWSSDFDLPRLKRSVGGCPSGQERPKLPTGPPLQKMLSPELAADIAGAAERDGDGESEVSIRVAQ